ncbi:MAG: outer membrane beta-barrel protein [Candidatus Binatia bacterium]
MRNSLATLLSACVALLVSATVVRAQVPVLPFESGQGNLRLGPVRVHPFLGVAELYDDNLFLQPTDKKDDFITVLSPGLTFHLPLGRHDFTIGYRADFLEFARFSQENTVRHDGKVGLRGKYPGGLSWYAQDEALRTNERPNTEQDPLIERTQNNAAVGTEYAFANRWAAGVDYYNTIYDYGNQQPLPDGTLRDYGTQLNRMEQLVTTDLYYLVQPKTALLVEYGYGKINFSSDATAADRDSTVHLGRAGVRGEITSKLTALVKLGYQTLDFDNHTRKNFEGFVASVDLVYLPAERTKIDLLIDRSTPVASFISQGDAFFVSNSVTLTIQQVLRNRMRGFVSGTFANNSYEQSARSDDYYAGAVGLNYQIEEYLGVSAAYLHARRNSSGTPGLDFDYNENRVFVAATAAL